MQWKDSLKLSLGLRELLIRGTTRGLTTIAVATAEQRPQMQRKKISELAMSRPKLHNVHRLRRLARAHGRHLQRGRGEPRNGVRIVAQSTAKADRELMAVDGHLFPYYAPTGPADWYVFSLAVTNFRWAAPDDLKIWHVRRLGGGGGDRSGPFSRPCKWGDGSCDGSPGTVRRGSGWGGWYDTRVCFGLERAAPIGPSPFAALPLDPLPPSAVVPIGLSPPCALPPPPWPILPSLLTLPFPWSAVPTQPPDFPCFDALATRGGRSTGMDRRKVVMCPRGGSDPQVDILGPKSRRWGRVPHSRRMGVFAWTPRANGEGSCPPLCGPTLSSACTPSLSLVSVMCVLCLHSLPWHGCHSLWWTMGGGV